MVAQNTFYWDLKTEIINQQHSGSSSQNDIDYQINKSNNWIMICGNSSQHIII